MRLTPILLVSFFTTLSLVAEAQPKRKAQPAPTPAPVAAIYPEVPHGAEPRAASPRDSDEIAHRASSFKWDAFIDVEGRLVNKDYVANRGFTLNDASLDLRKDFDRAKAVVELPFSSDLSGGTNRFTFADSIALAYLQLDRWAPVYLRLGQFESFFGVEANASRDRFFANWGAIKQYLLPKTHTGVQVGSSMHSVTLRGQIANPNGSGAMAKEDPEFAGDARFDSGPGYGSLGFSYNQARDSTTSNRTNMLVDLMGGLAANKFRADAEIDFKQTANTDKTANGFGLFGTFFVNDLLTAGARLEYLKDPYVVTAQGSGTYDSIFTFAVGPSYRLQDDIVLRGDFSMAQQKAPGVDETVFGVSVSLVANL